MGISKRQVYLATMGRLREVFMGRIKEMIAWIKRYEPEIICGVLGLAIWAAIAYGCVMFFCK
jgi:hypothetical protein